MFLPLLAQWPRSFSFWFSTFPFRHLLFWHVLFCYLLFLLLGILVQLIFCFSVCCLVFVFSFPVWYFSSDASLLYCLSLFVSLLLPFLLLVVLLLAVCCFIVLLLHFFTCYFADLLLLFCYLLFCYLFFHACRFVVTKCRLLPFIIALIAQVRGALLFLNEDCSCCGYRSYCSCCGTVPIAAAAGTVSLYCALISCVALPPSLTGHSHRLPLSPSPFFSSLRHPAFLTCHSFRPPLSSSSFFSSPRYPSSRKTMKHKRSKNSYPPQK